MQDAKRLSSRGFQRLSPSHRRAQGEQLKGGNRYLGSWYWQLYMRDVFATEHILWLTEASIRPEVPKFFGLWIMLTFFMHCCIP